jgi:hypothetical protein
MWWRYLNFYQEVQSQKQHSAKYMLGQFIHSFMVGFIFFVLFNVFQLVWLIPIAFSLIPITIGIFATLTTINYSRQALFQDILLTPQEDKSIVWTLWSALPYFRPFYSRVLLTTMSLVLFELPFILFDRNSTAYNRQNDLLGTLIMGVILVVCFWGFLWANSILGVATGLAFRQKYIATLTTFVISFFCVYSLVICRTSGHILQS